MKIFNLNTIMSNNNFVLGSRSVVSFNCLIVGENGCGKYKYN